jgi:hypothetical protein
MTSQIPRLGFTRNEAVAGGDDVYPAVRSGLNGQGVVVSPDMICS